MHRTSPSRGPQNTYRRKRLGDPLGAAPAANSVWAGDSLLAHPRHEPLTLLAAVASARAPRRCWHRRPAADPTQSSSLGTPGGDSRSGHGRSSYYLALASLPMCRISARSSLQRACLSKNGLAACSKVFGSPARCGAVKRSIGTAGGKSNTGHPWSETIPSRRAPDLDRRLVARKPRSRRSLVRRLAADRAEC
jgi:hypothetical protein